MFSNSFQVENIFIKKMTLQDQYSHYYYYGNLSREDIAKLLNMSNNNTSYPDYYYDLDYAEHSCADAPHPHVFITNNLPDYQRFFNVFLPTACAIGIVGIILTVVVLGRKNMTTSTNS